MGKREELGPIDRAARDRQRILHRRVAQRDADRFPAPHPVTGAMEQLSVLLVARQGADAEGPRKHGVQRGAGHRFHLLRRNTIALDRGLQPQPALSHGVNNPVALAGSRAAGGYFSGSGHMTQGNGRWRPCRGET